MNRPLAISLGCLTLLSAGKAASIHIVNPSFQQGDWPGWPGYAGSGGNPGEIPGWTGTGGRGVNGPNIDAGTAFSNNGAIPDSDRVAFVQGLGSLAQSVTGLTPGARYWLQGYANARAGGDLPVVGVSFEGQPLLSNQTLAPVGGNNPYYRVNLPFTASSNSGEILFTTRPAANGDATALFDGITLIQRNADEVVIFNPSFEASGTPGGVGYLNGGVAGWTVTTNPANVGQVAINAQNGAFNDVGFVPEGQVFAVLQNGVTLSQTLSGLTAGQPYRLTLDYAGRGCCGPGQAVADFRIDGRQALSGPVAPSGNRRLSFDFTASGTTALLSLGNAAPAPDTSLFLDNVSVRLIPEPGTALLGFLGLGTLLRRRRQTAAR